MDGKTTEQKERNMDRKTTGQKDRQTDKQKLIIKQPKLCFELHLDLGMAIK